MNLEIGRKYYLKCDVGGKVTRYYFTILTVSELDYNIRFHLIEDGYDDSYRTFDLEYAKENVNRNIAEGSWMIQTIIPPNQFDDSLFTMDSL